MIGSCSRALAEVEAARQRVLAALEGEPGDCLEIDSNVEREASLIICAAQHDVSEIQRAAETRCRVRPA